MSSSGVSSVTLILTLLQSSFPSYSRARRIGLCLNHYFILQWPQATLWVLVALELLPSPLFTSLIGAQWRPGQKAPALQLYEHPRCSSIIRTSNSSFLLCHWEARSVQKCCCEHSACHQVDWSANSEKDWTKLVRSYRIPHLFFMNVFMIMSLSKDYIEFLC